MFHRWRGVDRCKITILVSTVLRVVQRKYLCRNFSALRCSDFSHSILATAISHVSLTTSTSSFESLSSRSISRLSESPRAPSASAASCRHIESSSLSSRTMRRNGDAARFLVCPKQYASSCLRRAEGDVNAAAIAWMAGREDWQAKCLREKSARKRFASGSDSEVRVLRSAIMVRSDVGGGAGGDVAEGAILLSWDKV